jgi:NAD(P)-dependent dehydrogenase (short-subunit alcohol dehydrogenase family)
MNHDPMNRIAVITGASRGLGRALAGFLSAQGYSLVLTARDEEVLRESAEALKGKVVTVAGDVADAAHRRSVAAAAKSLGGLDLLVNNASSLGPVPMPQLADYPLDAFREVLEVNLVAPLALIQEVLPLLKERQGLVVNLSSDAAVGGYESWGGYGASKAALDLVSKTLASELKEMGVSVVSVDPGDMRTQMHQDAFLGEDISDRPLPEVTLPFWAWLLGRDPREINGGRFAAQAERWEPVGA